VRPCFGPAWLGAKWSATTTMAVSFMITVKPEPSMPYLSK
jgi:hypothetical protein